MSPQSWYKALRGQAAKKRLIRPQVRSRYLPLLERLEDRTVLDAVNWINTAGGDWDTAANWVDTSDSSHHAPGATDDVTINVAGNVTITHNQNVTDAVNSLTANDIVQLNAGTLDIAAALSSTSSFQMRGGTLGNAIVLAATTITGTTSGGTLNAVTIDGTLDLTTANQAHVSVTGGLTLANSAVLEIGSSAGNVGFLSFNGGNQTLGGNGSVLFGSSSNNTLWTGQSSGTNLTIGPNILIHGQNGVVGPNTGGFGGFADGTVTNQGTIDADVSGGLIQINGVNWTNANTGVIEAATGASATLAGSWNNNGSISAVANARLNLGSAAGAWTNDSTITAAANATVNLGGVVTNAALGTFSTTGANVNIVGTLTNTGSTLTLTDSSGTWRLMGGTIDGGTVVTTGSNALIATSSGGTLANGVTLDGTLDLTAANNVHVSVTGGLTLGAGTVLQIGSSTGNVAYLSFNGGNQTLGGSGSVLFGSSSNNTLWTGQSSGTNLTIGPNILIHGQNGVVGPNTGGFGGFADGTLTNQGAIDADVSGGLIQINGVNWTNANTGVIEAATGASATLAGSWNNNGSISAVAHATLNLGSAAGAWTNNSTITAAANATANLGGVVTNAALGAFTTTGANVNIVGTLTNTGSTLTLNDSNGTWHMMAGTIDGGTVATTGSNTLIATTSGGTLANGVTLDGTLDLTAANNVHLSVTGGLTLGAGTVLQIGSSTGNVAYLSFNGGNQTLGGNGSVLFGSSSNNTLWTGQSSGTNLTIGPNILIHGQNGVVGPNTGGFGGFADGTLTNQGAIDADVSGGLIQINGVNWTNANTGVIEAATEASATLAGSWSNNGSISAAAHATLNLGSPGGTWIDDSTITANANTTVNLGGTFSISTLGNFSAAGANVNIVGTLTNTGSTLTLTDTSGTWRLMGGTIDGGTLATTGSNALIATTSGGTLANGVTLDGTLDLTTGNNVRVSVTGGLTLVNGAVVKIGDNASDLGYVSFNGGNQTLVGSGSVLFGNSAGNTLWTGQSSGTNLTIGPDILIHGQNGVVGPNSAQFGGFVDGTFTNQGSIDADVSGGVIKLNGVNWTNDGIIEAQNGGAVLAAGTNTNVAAGTLTGGTWKAFASSTLRLIGGNITTNDATIVIDGANSNFFSDTGSTNALANFATNAATGSFAVQNGRIFTTAGPFSNAGVVFVGTGSDLRLASGMSYSQSGGDTSVEGALDSAGGTSNFSLQGGQLDGDGMVVFTNVINSGGQVNPGVQAPPSPSTPGSLSITGNFAQTGAGALNVRLGGTAAGTFDQLVVSGNVQLGGTLAVTLVNGFVPADANSFPIATFASNTPPSDFSTLSLPTLTGLVMEENLNSPNVTLVISPALILNPSTLPADTINASYDQAITGSGGTGEKNLVVTNIQNAIPGLNIPTNGVNTLTITGTPTATGTVTFTVSSTDTLGATIHADYSITVNPGLGLTPAILPSASAAVVYNQVITVVGGTTPYTNITVTNFNPGATGLTTGDFTTNTAAGTVTIDGTPAAPGTASFTVNVTDAAGAMLTQDYTLTVVPLLVSTPLINPTSTSEGTSTSFSINGTFTDPGDTNEEPFSAVVNWGDGATDLATVSGNGNPFSYAFSGNHTYAQSGAYDVTVSVTDLDGDTGTSAGTAITVANVAPTVAIPTVSPTSTNEGMSTSFTVSGSFTDPAGALDQPFTAVINWGDNSTDTATVTGAGNPFNYAFNGSHTYAQNGNYNVTVSVTDKDGGPGNSAPVVVSVANVPPTVDTPTVSPTTTNEGASTSFTVSGTFIDPANALDQPFVALINWGDNTTDTATVTGAGNPFNYAFNGSHTYAQNGSYNVTVSVTDKDGGSGTSAPVMVSVANVPPTVGTPTVSPTSTNEGASTSFTVSGTFTDPADALDEPFTAVINWGDNTADTATVTGTGNPFNYAFNGSHTYAQSGSYNVTVSVTDKDGGSGTSEPVMVSVANVPPTVLTPTISPTTTNEGASTSFTVSGTFTDPADALDEPFTAVINWGDNTADTATVTGAGNPFNYAFSGSHTYAQSGSYNVTVSVTDKDGGTGTSAPVMVSVANVPPTVLTPTVNPTSTNEGASTSFTLSGTFTDPANALDQPFVALINWGDNTTDIATVTGAGNPFNYAFNGSHTYAQSGSYNVTVSVTDKDGGTGTSAPVMVSVANVPPTVDTPTVSPTTTNEGASTSFTLSGSFTDPAGALDQPYNAVVNWGDGTTDPATVSGSGNPFGYAFSGSHTYAQSGNYNVTVSVTDKDGGTGTTSAVVVSVAASATHFSISAPSSATTGTAFGFTVTALDALNNPVTGYAGTVHLTSSDGSAILPIDSTLTGGTASFFATLNTAGVQTITATDASNDTITGMSGPVTVANSTTINKNTYVQQLYVDLLHRPADLQGQQFFTQLLNSGIASRGQLVLLFEDSPEYHRNEVENLYKQFLSRSADADGLAFWMAFLANGGTPLQVEAMILGSAEYFQVRGGSANQDFVDAIYHDVLGRSPDSAGDQFFGQYLANGGSRVELADIVLNSPEDEIVRVKGYYQQFLRRALEPAGQAYWVNLLTQGEPDEMVVAGIVGSDEYFERFPTFPG